MIETLMIGLALMQQPDLAKNPRRWGFECPEHDTDTEHYVYIYASGTSQQIQTINIGDPPIGPSGLVEFTLNVQPIKFGEYFIRVRSSSSEWTSDESAASEDWQRVPGSPGKPVVLPGQE